MKSPYHDGSSFRFWASACSRLSRFSEAAGIMHTTTFRLLSEAAAPVEPAAEAVDYFQNGSPLEIIFSFVPLVATVVLPALCVLMQVVVPMLSPAVITPADTKQWGAPAKKGFGNAAFRRAAVMAVQAESRLTVLSRSSKNVLSSLPGEPASSSS